MLVPFLQILSCGPEILILVFMDNYDGKKVIDIIHVDNSNLHLSQNQEELYLVARA
jgi:hypothetical protein